ERASLSWLERHRGRRRHGAAHGERGLPRARCPARRARGGACLPPAPRHPRARGEYQRSPGAPCVSPGRARPGARGGASHLGRMRRAWTISTAFFAALAALAYGLLPPGFALRWDNITQNFPAVLEVYRQLGEGRWPLWDPYMWSGSPLLADPQSQA